MHSQTTWRDVKVRGMRVEARVIDDCGSDIPQSRIFDRAPIIAYLEW